MAQKEKCCVLAIDVSGSVKDFKFYWDQVEELLNNLLNQNYMRYVVIAWSSRYEEITVEKLRECIRERNYLGGGTCPDLCWDFLHSKKLPQYDLHLVTDGEIDNKRYKRYIDMYHSLKYKPEEIHIYYFGRLGKMNMQFLDCFKNVQYVINGIDTNDEIVTHTSAKVDKDVLFQQLCDLDEFKEIETNIAKDLQQVLQNLYKKLYRKIIEYSENELNGAIGEEFKKFVVLVNEIVQRNYDGVNSGETSKDESTNFIQNEMAKNEEIIDDAATFDELFHNYKSNSKYIFDIFVKRFLNATTDDYKKILKQIIELGSGQSEVDRRLLAYGENWYGGKKQKSNDFDNDKDDDDSDESEQREEYGFTPINKILKMVTAESDASTSNSSRSLLISDSNDFNKFCVVWIGVDDLFGGDQFHQMLGVELRYRVSKNTMRLFEFLSNEDLSKRIPSINQHISMDEFLGLESTTLNTIDNKESNLVYKPQLHHQAPCFGIILYNADNKDNFPATITQNDMNILLHNYTTIAQLLFGSPKFNGSFPLLHTFFLQMLNQCQQICLFTKECIEETLERTMAILKCPFMIKSGLEPCFHSSVKNAIIFHTDIYPNEIDKRTESLPEIEALNVPRKNVQYCSGLLDLAKDQFGVIYSKEYEKKLKFWKFWNYMLKSNMTHDEKMLHFKQIALTKIQNWHPIEIGPVKIMFVEGKSKKSYFEYLDDIDFDDIVKLIVLFENEKVKTSTIKLCMENIDLAKNGQWYNVKTVEKIDEFSSNMMLVEFCKATCAYPVISPFAKLVIDFCDNKKINFQEFTEKSAMTLYSNYVQNCKDLIIEKTGNEKIMEIPSVDELKNYILRKKPLAVYHTDFDTILENIINKYSAWNNWYKSADENEKEKYLWIDSDWKKILEHNIDVKSNEKLATCDCEGHEHLNVYSKIRSTIDEYLNSNNNILLYSIVFVIISLILMLFFK